MPWNSTPVNRLALKLPHITTTYQFISVGLVIICILVFSTTSLHNTRVVERLKDSAKGRICDHDRLVFGNPTISDSFQSLFQAIRHPVSAPTYTDAYGKVFDTKKDGPWWKEPLRNEILILDIDTRVPQGKNELWNDGRLNWEAMKEEGDGGLVSASFMNHFLYAQIHGYDYRFFNAHDMEGLHNTWVKPHVLFDLLHSYRFVIFIDADATIQHLELPFEWLFNKWGITPQTSIALPLDSRQTINGDEHVSEDSKGRLQLNTGVVVAQALPYTFEMLKAWKECPEEKRYPGCALWKEEWSHEQRAFSEYIRYDFNPTGTNIIEIPCDDAVGYPGLAEHEHINSNCTGQFIRHHTIDKAMTKRSTEVAMLQVLTDLTRKELLSKKETYWIRET
ncbi:uncharacterized protein K460DRAFT_375593 [Cucurbitaria berberidis CBS 394.84]|uniref:Nucleotide-diphospho-sugar transferase domain-containing protein n=1 Tax=Cucurbitaria berberidis CBS 394.84 TaxID=1168544 RepID=A0A9P4GNC2_9PLEO|nr:uncharacterized protein K460DRAFT_375593 [Cucurbitaria berberidis CBS 394.84]KAF1848822.1 hypothetical protein K460DRAFT_375593 [Cucurbitaria berberidis CBS 394.84]